MYSAVKTKPPKQEPEEKHARQPSHLHAQISRETGESKSRARPLTKKGQSLAGGFCWIHLEEGQTVVPFHQCSLQKYCRDYSGPSGTWLSAQVNLPKQATRMVNKYLVHSFSSIFCH